MNNIHAKPIIDGVLWLVEQDGNKIATLRRQNDKKYMMYYNYSKFLYNKKEELISSFGDSFFSPSKNNDVDQDMKECYGYKTEVTPHNIMYDIKKHLPLYTKTKKSKCLYCAGWYAIKSQKWDVVLSPKLIHLSRHTFVGPFHSRIEAEELLCTKLTRHQ